MTDDALTYTISELRKALGDDAKAPRFIQTIPKKGYRLIARVEAESSPVPSSLYRISSDMNGVGERSISEAGVETVILGSFMKVGNNIRIKIRVQDATSGETLASARVEAMTESSLFAMVADLTGRIKTYFPRP